VHDIIKQIDPDVLRFFMISVHYRSPINYNVELVEAAKSGLERVRNSYQAIEEREAIATNIEDQSAYVEAIDDILKQFETVMNDDFNTANAITEWYDLAKLANKYILENTTSTTVIERFKQVYEIFSDVLGVPLKGKESDMLLDEQVEALIEERNKARQNKDFARADEIRDDLKAQNIILEDTAQGVRFKRG
ncbi:cysteine--tRNA ligase, partial [Staphylococcus cohnii]